MTANVDAMVRAGVDAFQKGNKTDARALLERALELDEYNEQAWLWLSAVVETAEEQRTCLENVLVINPQNERARMGLKSLGVDPDLIAAPPPEADLFDAPPAAGAPAFTSTDWEDDADDAPPTASSSASSASFREQSANYDDWVSNLGIGAKKPTSGGAFDTVDTGLFGSDDFDDFDRLPAAPAKAAAPVVDDFDTFVADDPFEDDVEEVEDFERALADFDAAVNENISRAGVDEFVEDDMVEEDIGLDNPFDDVDRGEDVDLDFDEDEDGMPEPDIMQYFQLIPKEIEATRLPGQDEPSPMLWVGLVLLLILMNVGALFFMLQQIA